MLTRLGTPSHPDLPGVVGPSGVDSPSPGAARRSYRPCEPTTNGSTPTSTGSTSTGATMGRSP